MALNANHMYHVRIDILKAVAGYGWLCTVRHLTVGRLSLQYTNEKDSKTSYFSVRMPRNCDIYVNQLRTLRKGYPLYHPEPPEEGPVEVGDVGYIKEGSFYRLFNVSRSANNSWGVPNGFEPLNIGRIRTFAADLEPGPLHSETIFQVSANIGASGAPVLPADASFTFSCTSSQGTILMLETEMDRQVTIQSDFFRTYAEKHCLSWYAFAEEKGIPVEFGDILLVTGCSRTAAWSSAVYSNSSTEFGITFSVGGNFLPSLNGVAVTAYHGRIGPVERRRSHRHGTTLVELEDAPKDQTLFIQAYHLGPRKLYAGSVAQKVRKAMDRMLRGRNDNNSSTPSPSSSASQNERSPFSPTRHSESAHGLSESIAINENAMVTSLSPEWPDFHPAVALLAHVIDTTDVDIVIVHDDEWCSVHTAGTTRTIVDQYAQCFFNGDFLDEEKIELENKFDQLLIQVQPNLLSDFTTLQDRAKSVLERQSLELNHSVTATPITSLPHALAQPYTSDSSYPFLTVPTVSRAYDTESSAANNYELVTMSVPPSAYSESSPIYDTGAYLSSTAYDIPDWLLNTEYGQLFEAHSPLPSSVGSDVELNSDASNPALFGNLKQETSGYPPGYEPPVSQSAPPLPALVNAEHGQSFESQSLLQISINSNITLASDPSDPTVVGKQVASDATLMASAKRRMKIAKYLCSFCPQRLTSRSNLIHHEDAHRDIRRFSCEYCPDRSFRTRAVLKRHQKSLRCRKSQ